jgi:hypothetical protein
MTFNWLAIFGSALIPLLVGFIWYSPKVFGNTWMKSIGLKWEDGKGMNMALVFGVSLFVAIMMAAGLLPIVIHQMGAMSTLVDEPGFNDPNSEMGTYFAQYMAKYGRNFRTFQHGALHGAMTALFVILPVVATSSLYERRSWKYVAVTVGYWMVSLALMGGVICAFG